MIRFALIGCGRIALRYAKLLSKNSIPGAQLLAVCDHDPEKANSFHDTYSVPCVYSQEELYDKFGNDIDVVCVLTHSGDHYSSTLLAASHGKHIVVEKPIALTLKHGHEMIAACKKNNSQLFVVKQNRYNLPIKRLKQAITNGDLGKIHLANIHVLWCRDQSYYDQASWRGTWKNDGGVLANQAIHHIDLLQWLVGPVKSIFAKSIRALSKIEAEDTAVATITFENGAIGTIEATTATRPTDIEASITLLGSKGTVKIGGFALNKVEIWNTSKKDQPKDIHEWDENPPNIYGFGHQSYLTDVVNTLNKKTQPSVDGEEALKALEILTGAYQAIETGKEIQLPLKEWDCQLG